MTEFLRRKRGIPLDIGQRIGRAFKFYLIFFFLIAGPFLFMPKKVYSYIMPAEQLLGLMTANFSKFKTLLIRQSTHLMNLQNEGEVIAMEEKIWLNSSGFYHLELMGQPEGQKIIGDDIAADRASIDMTFRRILMSNDCKTIMALLSEIGVKIETVAFTRLDGAIAYRVGDKSPESPNLIVEKERFLPLLLSYGLLDESGEKRVTVRFDDYRKTAEGWYPYKIVYFGGKNIEEHYFVIDLQANVPNVFPISRIGREGPNQTQELKRRQDSPEDERLREVIKALEEKYR